MVYSERFFFRRQLHERMGTRVGKSVITVCKKSQQELMAVKTSLKRLSSVRVLFIYQNSATQLNRVQISKRGM